MDIDTITLNVEIDLECKWTASPLGKFSDQVLMNENGSYEVQMFVATLVQSMVFTDFDVVAQISGDSTRTISHELICRSRVDPNQEVKINIYGSNNTLQKLTSEENQQYFQAYCQGESSEFEDRIGWWGMKSITVNGYMFIDYYSVLDYLLSALKKL